MNKIQKIYYSIREVSEQTEVEPHVLRFWEKEFSMLRPKRGRSRSRAYRERDIRIVLAIKDLLYNQKYTIQGAAEQLKKDRSLWEDLAIEKAKQVAQRETSLLSEFREALVELKNMIDGDDPSKEETPCRR